MSAAVEGSVAGAALEGFAPYLMNRIMGRYNAALQGELARMGLTTPKARSLATLAVIPGPTIRELAVYTVTDPSTLSRALDQLQAEGLIRRESCSADSRATRLHLTEAGHARAERLWPLMGQAEAALFQGVPEAERQAFLATLRCILHNIRHNPF